MRPRLILVAASLCVLTACPPTADPGPQARWAATRFARTTANDPDPLVRFGAWTSDEWFATSQLLPAFVSTVELRKRSGAHGATLSAPQTITSSLAISSLLPGGSHDLIGLRGFVGDGPAVEILGNDGATWQILGRIALDAPAVAMNDRWLVTRSQPLDGSDAVVTVHRIDTSGAEPTLLAGQTLAPDPTWSAGAQAAFGTTIALDGDLLVATVPESLVPGGGGALAPGAARVFRAGSGGWAPVQTIDGSTAGAESFGFEVGADDGAGVDRLVFSATAGPGDPDPGRRFVEVYADAGSGFHPEATLRPDPADPDTAGGAHFGNALSIDGTLIAVASRRVDVPSAVPGASSGAGGYVRLLRYSGGGWRPTAEVATFVDPLPEGFGVMRPVDLQVAGDHVAVLTFAPERECGFEPCFDLSFEAWSIDRTS